MAPAEDAFIQTAEQLAKMANAFKESRVLLTALELDVFTLMDKTENPARGVSASQLARAAGADARAMDRLLRACCALGLARHVQDDLFSNTPLGARHLVRGKQDFLASMDHLQHLYHSWSSLTQAVRKGGTVMDVPDMSLRDGSWFEPFMAAMYSRSRRNADAIISKLDLNNVSTLLDVGGGPGAYAMTMAYRRPGLKVTVFDLPQVTPYTRHYLFKNAMEHAVDTRDGNFMRDPLHKTDGSGYDMVFFSAIVHMLSPDENALLMKKAARAVNPGGSCVVLDFVMNEDRISPKFGALFSLNMVAGTQHGDTYTEKEIREWLVAAGFADPVRIAAGPDVSFIRAWKAK